MGLVHTQAANLLARMSLISYGAVQAYNTKTRASRGAGKPNGDAHPMADEWAALFAAARDEDHLRDLVSAGQAALDAWIRRPLAADVAENLEDLCSRIVGDGWGVSADECSRAMRCTPTLVRRARLEASRHPETGYHLPARLPDAMAWARSLEDAGLSLRQIEALTGLPKSTLHDRLSRPRRATLIRGIVGESRAVA